MATMNTHGLTSMKDSSIRIGTSAFTARGWAGTFYPRSVKSADYLSYYAEYFDAVEVDSTFYVRESSRTATMS